MVAQRRILVRTHWIAERPVKVGRGHVCNSDPTPLRADLTLAEISPCSVGLRSMRLALARLFGVDIFV